MSHWWNARRGAAPYGSRALTSPRGKQVTAKVGGPFECDDSRILGDATYAGLGIGLWPEQELAEAVERKVLMHVLPGWRFGEQPAYLLTTSGRRDLPRVRAVADALDAAMRTLR